MLLKHPVLSLRGVLDLRMFCASPWSIKASGQFTLAEVPEDKTLFSSLQDRTATWS